MEPLSQFDNVAPGIMVMSVLLVVTFTATTLAREVELGTLQRFRLARARPISLIAGVTVAQLIVGSVAFLLMLLAGWLMGFHNQGSPLAAYVVILLTAVVALGFGMLVAAFVKGRDEAANLAAFLMLPMGFLSGAFFKIPGVTIWHGARGPVDLYDLLPTTHAIAALKGIMNEGQSLGDVAVHVGALAVLALLTFAWGTFLYGRRRMTRPAG